MDLTPVLTPDTGAIGFLVIVLWEIFKRFIVPKIPFLIPYFPATPGTSPAPAPAPVAPAPIAPVAPAVPAVPDGIERPLLDFLKRAAAEIIKRAPELLPKLLPLLPLIIEKPVEEKKPDEKTPNQESKV